MLAANSRKFRLLTFIVASTNIFLCAYYYTKTEKPIKSIALRRKGNDNFRLKTSKVSIDHHVLHVPVEVDKDEKLSKALLNATTQHTILMWYPMFGERTPVTIDRENCGNCIVSYDRNRADEESTKAIIFHFGEANLNDMPKTRRTDQLYIWWTLESTRAIRSLQNMELKRFDNFFNLSMSYRRDSDIYYPYGTSAEVLRGIQDEDGSPLNDIDELVKYKSGFSLWIVSNCGFTKGAKYRMEISQQLINAGLDLDQSGYCFPKVEKIPEKKRDEIISSYKFYMAFENNVYCLDYLTEKLFLNSLLLGVVPVVLGAKKKDYEAIVPPQSCIFVDDFESPKKLVEYLQYLDKNNTAYKEYLQWRTMKVEEMPNYKRANGFCQLCRILHGINVDNLYNPYYNQSYSWIPMYGAPKAPQVVPSLREWFYGRENKECLETY